MLAVHDHSLPDQRPPAAVVEDLRVHLELYVQAGTKELMYRLGLAGPQTALRYQHATRPRDGAIADAMVALISDGTLSGTSAGTPRASP